MFSGHVGVDPYTTAVSDVYQDLFHEGSYVGKGIYDVDAFDAALAGRVPENPLLSHDLFEGFYARAGLCTDIEPRRRLSRALPGRSRAAAPLGSRRLADRALAVADRAGCLTAARSRTRCRSIARWKILDNLRRSLSRRAGACCSPGWTVLPGSARCSGRCSALLVLAFPAYIQVARSLGSHRAGRPAARAPRAERDNIVVSLRQSFLSIGALAHQSVVMVDAIARTLARLASRATTPARVGDGGPRRQAPEVDAVVEAHVAGARAGGSVRRRRRGVDPLRLVLGAPILALWFLSPASRVCDRASPSSHRRPPLGRDDRPALRRWRDDVALLRGARRRGGPLADPDNYQENRPELVAHRTSPTNIGLQLLATLSAHDFGYLTSAGVLDRLEPTFDTLLKMQRYRGHFYNWYDTRTLAPLAPAYISTVDSGNLAGYLLTLRFGLREIADDEPDRRCRASFEGCATRSTLFETNREAQRRPSGPALRAETPACARSSRTSAVARMAPAAHTQRRRLRAVSSAPRDRGTAARR